MQSASDLCNNAQMIDWDDLRYVLAVARCGGLSGAARDLGVNHSTVSRRIGALEERIGVRLFDRLPSGLVATKAGEEAIEAARQAETRVVALERKLAGRDRSLSGTLTVTAPQLVIQAHLAEVFLDYASRYPDVAITVNASNTPLNLHRREADVAIRVSDSPEDSLFGRRATGQQRAFYVSRDYYELHRETIEQPGPSAGLDCLVFTWWEDDLPDPIRARYPASRVAMRFDDMVAMIACVRAGMGSALMPCFLGDPDPGLVRLPDIALQRYLDIWVVTHPDLRRVERVRSFMGYVTDALKAREDVYMGRAISAP
jgi:DNA-binding transcriptional LysR family regulator